MCVSPQRIHEELLRIVNETLPDENKELYDLAELFAKVFGDSTRIRILLCPF